MLRTLSLATLGLAALAAGPAFAMAPETVVVHVPLAFVVSNVTLPAGDYTIQPLSDVANDVLEIRSTDGRHSVLVLSNDARGERRGALPKLVFDRYGDQDFLRAVELPEEAGADLSATRSEIKAARDLASPHKE
jgi:hypothetical protein